VRKESGAADSVKSTAFWRFMKMSQRKTWPLS